LLVEFWGIGVALLGVGALVASDFVAGSNSFWADHPMLASLASGTLLALLAVVVLDRVLRYRSRRRWRPIAAMLARRLSNLGDADADLTALCEDFCAREFGGEYPKGTNYFTLLPYVLAQRETWLPDAFGTYVLQPIGEDKEELEKTLADWGSVLVSDPQLAELGAAAQELLDATGRIHAVLNFGRPHPGEDSPIQPWWASDGAGTRYLVEAILLHRDASRRIWKMTEGYRRERGVI
jgi:hypothetical protein